MKDEYIAKIMVRLKSCNDLALLDLILQILYKSQNI